MINASIDKSQYYVENMIVCLPVDRRKPVRRYKSSFSRWFNKYLIKRRWKSDRKTNEVLQTKRGREAILPGRPDAQTKAVLPRDSFVRSLPVRASHSRKTPSRVIVLEKFKSRIRGETAAAAPTDVNSERVVREFTGRESDG